MRPVRHRPTSVTGTGNLVLQGRMLGLGAGRPGRHGARRAGRVLGPLAVRPFRKSQEQLTAVGAYYPGTDLVLRYEVPAVPRMFWPA